MVALLLQRQRQLCPSFCLWGMKKEEAFWSLMKARPEKTESIFLHSHIYTQIWVYCIALLAKFFFLHLFFLLLLPSLRTAKKHIFYDNNVALFYLEAWVLCLAAFIQQAYRHLVPKILSYLTQWTDLIELPLFKQCCMSTLSSLRSLKKWSRYNFGGLVTEGLFPQHIMMAYSMKNTYVIGWYGSRQRCFHTSMGNNGGTSGIHYLGTISTSS